jgi:hypothetical protein
MTGAPSPRHFHLRLVPRPPPLSIALQFGADLETIRQALTKDHDGGPATLLGAALDKLTEGVP